MLCAARDGGARSFVFASSSSVYGDDAGAPQARRGGRALLFRPTPLSKIAGESYCQIFSSIYGLPTVGPALLQRLRAPPGPGFRNTPRPFPIFIARMLRGERPAIFGDGEQTRDFVFVEDVVAGQPPGRRGAGRSRRGLQHRLRRREPDGERPGRRRSTRSSGRRIDPVHAAGRAGGHPAIPPPTSRRPRRALGFRPAVSDSDGGLERTIAWYREQRRAS